jgi:hypothetical protein
VIFGSFAVKGPEVLSGDGVLVIGKLSDGYVSDASRVLHSVLPRVFFPRELSEGCELGEGSLEV